MKILRQGVGTFCTATRQLQSQANKRFSQHVKLFCVLSRVVSMVRNWCSNGSKAVESKLYIVYVEFSKGVV